MWISLAELGENPDLSNIVMDNLVEECVNVISNIVMDNLVEECVSVIRIVVRLVRPSVSCPKLLCHCIDRPYVNEPNKNTSRKKLMEIKQ